MDIQALVNDSIAKLIDENKIAKMIQSGVEKAIESAIDDQFRRYGSFTKQIEKAFEEGLQFNVKEFPFETYNQQMLVAIKQKLGSAFMTDASNVFLAEIEKTLKPAPKEISIKELVETVVAAWKSDEPWDADYLDEQAKVELEEPHWSSDGKSFSLKMWKQEESSGRLSLSRGPDLEVYISSGHIRINHHQSYNPTCFSEEDAFIFKLYAAKTKITGLADFDPDECDLTLKEMYD